MKVLQQIVEIVLHVLRALSRLGRKRKIVSPKQEDSQDLADYVEEE